MIIWGKSMCKKIFKDLLNLVLLAFVVFILMSCSWFSKTPSKFTYNPAGIRISYIAESNLNYYDQSPHSVMLVVYQLNTISGFLQLASDSAGINKLLMANKFDSTVIGVDSKFVFPNESGEFKIDRLENTQWIGIVVGYYKVKSNQITKVFQIPKYDDDVLNVRILLNNNSIQEIKQK